MGDESGNNGGHSPAPPYQLRIVALQSKNNELFTPDSLGHVNDAMKIISAVAGKMPSPAETAMAYNAMRDAVKNLAPHMVQHQFSANVPVVQNTPSSKSPSTKTGPAV